MQDSNCIFCKIIQGTSPSYKVWEDSDYVAFLSIQPIKPGHTLVVPKEHTDYLFDLPEKTYQGLFEAGRKLARPLQAVTQSNRVGLMAEGFGVPHANLHLVPMTKGGEMNFSKSVKGIPEELSQIQEKIKRAIELMEKVQKS